MPLTGPGKLRPRKSSRTLWARITSMHFDIDRPMIFVGSGLQLSLVSISGGLAFFVSPHTVPSQVTILLYLSQSVEHHFIALTLYSLQADRLMSLKMFAHDRLYPLDLIYRVLHHITLNQSEIPTIRRHVAIVFTKVALQPDAFQVLIFRDLQSKLFIFIDRGLMIAAVDQKVIFIQHQAFTEVFRSR